MIHRRSLLLGLGSLLASPAIVRAGSLMRIVQPKPIIWCGYPFEGRQLEEIISMLTQANEFLDDFPPEPLSTVQIKFVPYRMFTRGLDVLPHP